MLMITFGSVDNVHVYCMFEAADTYENMMRVWQPFHWKTHGGLPHTPGHREVERQTVENHKPKA